jgi:hypothetical protein
MATTKQKYERSLYGPTVTEVTLGAVLSISLGAVLGALYLALKPVTTAKALPAEPEVATVYYIEGSANGARGRQYLRKRQLFLEGGSAEVITLSEDELNTWMASSRANPDARGSASGWIVPQSVNFRVREGRLQIGLPCTVDALGFSRPLVIQARGGFARRGEQVAFQPNEMYVGSLAAHRVPGLSGFVWKRVLASQEIPTEIRTAWQRVDRVTVENDQVVVALR